jgi:hypothetical protein
VYTFGYGDRGREGGYERLGHGGMLSELVPRVVEALAGTNSKVVGASTGLR